MRSESVRGGSRSPHGVAAIGLVLALLLGVALLVAPAPPVARADDAAPTAPMPMMQGMPGAWTPRPPNARPFYLAPAVLALAAAAAGVAAFLAYRAVPRWRRRRLRAADEAVLVVDLVESTHLATHYGDALALRARNTLKDRALAAARDHGVVFAENTGDGWFMTFSSVGAALRSATDLLRGLLDHPADLAPAPPIEARAAITYGEILFDGRGTRHGATINKAFRLVGLAPESFAHVAGEAEQASVSDRNRILLDEQAAQELAAAEAPRQFVGFSRLKGFPGLHSVYEVLWQTPDEPREP